MFEASVSLQLQVPNIVVHVMTIMIIVDSVHHTTTTTILRPFFRDHVGEPVPEENFWTLWCKGRLTEADTQRTAYTRTKTML